MNKYHCLFAGIVGIVLLDSLAIVVLHTDGVLIAASSAGIGSLVGIAFNKKIEFPSKPEAKNGRH